MYIIYAQCLCNLLFFGLFPLVRRGKKQFVLVPIPTRITWNDIIVPVLHLPSSYCSIYVVLTNNPLVFDPMRFFVFPLSTVVQSYTCKFKYLVYFIGFCFFPKHIIRMYLNIYKLHMLYYINEFMCNR